MNGYQLFPDGTAQNGQRNTTGSTPLSNVPGETTQALEARSCWPTDDKYNGVDISGINCLVVLLKYMVTTVGRRFWAQNGLDRNPFIQYAWASSSIADDHLNSISLAVWGVPLDQVPAAPLCFACLVSLPIMEEFWTADFCNPSRQPVWKMDFQQCWYPADEEQTPGAVLSAIERGRPNIGPRHFRFEAFPGMRLIDQINNRFGFFADEEGGIHIALPALPSAFFFATFNVHGISSGQKLNFDEFRTFTLKISDPDCSTVRYNLLAIVKHKDRGGGAPDSSTHDTIRVYKCDGRPVQPAARDCSYANPDWKLADMGNGDTFFAVYARNLFPPNLVTPSPETFEEWTRTGVTLNGNHTH